jgi:hypothetical protein
MSEVFGIDVSHHQGSIDWEQVAHDNKKFVIIGGINAIKYKEVFPLIKADKVWAGFNFNKTIMKKLFTIVLMLIAGLTVCAQGTWNAEEFSLRTRPDLSEPDHFHTPLLP